MFKFFLFFLFSTSLFAVDSGTDWWIYSYEDINTLKSVFNYLAMINQDNGYMETLRFAIYTGMVFSLFIKFLDITAIPRYFVTAIATMMVVFGTSATVHVVNVKSYDSLNPNIDNYAKIDNVPYIFAILTSCFSNIGYNSALLIETIFTSITDNEQIMETSFLKAGHMGTYKILTKLDAVDMFSINDNGKLLNKLLDNYLQSCIYDIALSLDPRIKNEITNQSDFMTYLSPSSSSNETIKSIGTIGIQKYDGTSTTCNALFSQSFDLFNLIKNDSKLYSAAKKLASKDTSNFDKAASSVVSMMNQSDLTGTQAKITTYIMNNGLMSAIENSWQNYGVGISSATNSSAQAGFGAGLAISQMQLAGKVKAKSASMILPSMHSVLQAVMYVLFPIILIVQLFAGGIKIIQNYVLGLLWLELWIPSYSVLNYFTTREAQTEAINRLINSTNDTPGAYGILTMANANEIYNTIANEASIAADMYWMIPALAGFILFASFHSISGITGAVAGAVGQYSSTQTLDAHRSEYAALDNVNKELERQNPLYTGDIGSLKQMQSQLQYQGAASVAAGKLLASGSSSIDSVGNATSPDMFSGMKDMSSTKGEQKQTTGGGPLTNAMGKYDNQGGLTGSKVNGDFKASTLDGNLYSKIENSTAGGTLENASTGDSRFNALDSKKGGIVNTLGEITKNEQEQKTSQQYTEAQIIGNQSSNAGNASGKLNAGSKLADIKVASNFDTNEIVDSKVFKDVTDISGNNAKSNVYDNNIKTIKDVSATNSAYDAGKNQSTANTYGTTSNASSVGSGVGKIESNTNIGKSNEANNQNGERFQNAASVNVLKELVSAENEQTKAHILFKAGYLNTDSTESYFKSLGQKAESTSYDGKSISVVADNEENIIGKTESKHTEKGVETNWIDKNDNIIKSDRNSDFVNSAKKVNDTSITNNSSNTTNADVVDTAKKVNDTSVMNNSSNTTNADVVDTAKNEYNRSKNINTTDTVDSSMTRKDNWTVEGKTSIDINQMYKRTEGKDAYDSFEKTMISINNADSVRNLFSNPIGGITDIYASIKSEYIDSIGKDGEKRTNFEPDTINYLEKRQEQFFNFSSSNGVTNNNPNTSNINENKSINDANSSSLNSSKTSNAILDNQTPNTSNINENKSINDANSSSLNSSKTSNAILDNQTPNTSNINENKSINDANSSSLNSSKTSNAILDNQTPNTSNINENKSINDANSSSLNSSKTSNAILDNQTPNTSNINENKSINDANSSSLNSSKTSNAILDNQTPNTSNINENKSINDANSSSLNSSKTSNAILDNQTPNTSNINENKSINDANSSSLNSSKTSNAILDKNTKGN